MKQWILCVFWTLLGGSLVYSAEKNIMPREFESIELGMDWGTFLGKRPHVEILNFLPEPGERVTPDPKQPQEGLIETFPDGAKFSTGIYGFKHGHLVFIMLVESLDDAPGHRESYLRNFANQYGVPTTISLADSPPNHGVMVWRRDDAEVHAIVPVKETITGNRLLTLRIITPTYADRLELVKPDKEKNSTRTSVETAALDALMHEMRTYASEENTSGNHSENSQEQPQE